MKALVRRSFAAGDMVLMDVPEPSPGPGMVKLKVEYAGICSSDVGVLKMELTPAFKRLKPPVVAGHEGVGTVVEVGPGVSRVRVGDRVASETTFAACGVCRYCRGGDTGKCIDRRSLGWSANGYYAEYLIANELHCHKIAGSVDSRGAAVLEPLSCTVKAVMHGSELHPGDVALVFGPGPIGQCLAQVAKVSGAYVVVVGTRRGHARLEVAQQLGADEIWSIPDDDITARVLALTDGYGADVVYDCVGTQQSLSGGLQCVRRQGQFVFVSGSKTPLQIDCFHILIDEIRTAAAEGGSPQSWDKAVDLVNHGHVNLAPLVSDIFPLTRWEEAFATVDRHEGLKVLLQP